MTRQHKQLLRSQSLILKDATGRWRWLSISSNSFMDRLGEVISQEALERDVLRADLMGDYGPLLWWHQRDLVLGQCDFNMMYGRMLVESGTFIDETIPAILAPLWWSFGVSIGFYHAEDEPVVGPDWVPTYYNILRDERSVLPWEWAANSYTAFLTGREDEQMNKAVEALTAVLGPQIVGSLLDQANQLELDLTAQGVVNKDTPEANLPALIQLSRMTQKDDGEGDAEADAEDESDTTADDVATRLSEAYSQALVQLTEVSGQLGQLVQTMGTITQVQTALEAEATESKAFRETTAKALHDQSTLLAGLVGTNLRANKGGNAPAGFRASGSPTTVTPEAEKLSHTGKEAISDMDKLADAL